MSDTYLSLCSKFRKIVGISGTGPAAVTGQSGMNEKITLWVADADDYIQQLWEDWNFLLNPKQVITATAAINTFTPSDLSITDLARWRETSFVRDPGTADYQKLSYDMSYEDFITSEMYLGAAVTGPIERVIIRPTDSAVIFYPTPTSNTTVWAAYYKAPTRMSANTSTSPIPTRFDEIILARAKMYYAEHYEDMSLYQTAEREFISMLSRLEVSQLSSFKGGWTASDDNYQDIMVE